jgi:cellulose synthase operon protein C
LTAEALARIESFCDRALMLQAYEAAQPFGPIQNWREPGALVPAIRLAAHLGAPRLSAVLSRRAWRADRTHPGLAAYHAHALLQRRGPLWAWEFLERFGEPSAAAPGESRMHFYSIGVLTFAALRDFETAREWLAKGSAIGAGCSWMAVTEAGLLEVEDRYEESLAAARASLASTPWYRPGVQAVAHVLQLLDRDEEALELLEAACHHLEHCQVTRQLACLQLESGRYEAALATLARFESEAPLLEPQERDWLQRQRLDLACRRGATAETVALARSIDAPDCRELAQRAERGGSHARRRLEVPFIRQHHMTCAPATLSALARFWGQPAEHLEIVEAICYDGTPAHSERRWAETHGWRVREFTITWEAAVALLNLGVPFTLTTAEATSAHLQAVVGYDELRRTLCLRDPFYYHTHDVPADALLQRYRATGPRGMVLVPDDRGALLDGLALPDASLYDRLFKLHCALDRHRRTDASQHLEALAAEWPSHRVTLAARRSLAAYDGDTIAQLACLDELLRQFPEDDGLNLAKLSCLRELAHRADRMALLEQRVFKPGVDPIFWERYAQELRADARQLAAAENWVRWALRYRPVDPELISARADLLWDRQHFAAATCYYRLAACLGDRRESFAQSYFTALRHQRRTEAGLQFLEARHARLGPSSAEPAITWIEALQQLGRTSAALAALDAGLARRPDDGRLRLFAAAFRGRCGYFEEAERCLREAREQVSAAAWHRAAAALAESRIEKPAALEHWRSVLAIEPLAHDAIRSVSRLLAETEGREAALRFLDRLCAQYPFSCPLLALRIDWLKEAEMATVIPALRQFLDVNPANAWAWRELALQLNATGSAAEAFQAAEEAIRLEPCQSAGYTTRASMYLADGQLEPARADLREAIRLEVDNGYALTQYVATAPTLPERRQALEEVAAELRRQVIFQDALFAYRDAACGLMPPRAVLDLLREAHAARPDLWQSWAVLIEQLVDVGEPDEALGLARQATERFPWLPGVWAALGRVEQVRLNPAGQIAALERALELHPDWSFASRQLASIYRRQNELPQARAVLERAIAAAPLDALNHSFLAQVMWTLGERSVAFDRVQHAIRLDPDCEPAWNALGRWATELGQPGLAAETARDLTRRRAGDPRSWLWLAKSLPIPEAEEELFAAVDRALALSPRCVEAYDRRAEVLALLDRFDEALTQCAPPVFRGVPPALGIRAAWIEARQGNLAQAVVRVQATLSDHPEYYAGWQQLSDWLLQLGRGSEAIQAAERMSALAPHEPVPLGYLGDLKQQFGDPAGAQAVFRRAFELDPDYEYAGSELFKHQLAARDLSGAEATLAVLARRGDNPGTLLARVELAVAHRDVGQARERFASLMACVDLEEAGFVRAIAALEGLLDRKELNRLLKHAVSQPAVPPGLAAAWVYRQTQRRRWRLHARLAALPAETGARRLAVLRYLDHLGETLSRALQAEDILVPPRLRHHFRRILRRHGAWLREDQAGWGRVGYLLTMVGRPRAVVKWLGDWKSRPNAESWVLYNLVFMLQSLQRFEEAREVIRHAVQLRHEPHQFRTFTIWAAFEEALAGNLAEATRYLARLPAGAPDDGVQPMRVMTELLITLGPNPGESRQQRFASVRAGLRTAFPALRPFAVSVVTREGYRRWIRKVAGELGGLRLRLWGWWFYRGWDWGWLPMLILLLPIACVVPPFWLVWWRCYRQFRPVP